MPHTANTCAVDRHWILTRCCGLFTHYRPTPDSTTLACTRSGGYEGCGRTIQPADFPQAAPGDEVNIHDGILKYGIDPVATFTHSHPGGEFGWSRTFTAREIDRYLSEICSRQGFQIGDALLEAARTGECNHESGYGLKTCIVRA
ncbi:hypothetical protein ACIQGT_40065 [Streptomyces sp. NPDC093108]|uniref:hypothetical protein n=1 Tax=Streptomyces sp. NPDC093108 TaxID=3366030 RepID=UPI0038009767